MIWKELEALVETLVVPSSFVEDYIFRIPSLVRYRATDWRLYCKHDELLLK